MGVADARAIIPGIDVVEADADADSRLLEGIADWCDRYTPLVALEGEEGLFLDITGSAHLFGGEESLLDDMLARLLRQGIAARGAIASTPGAAWAAARFRHGAVILRGGEAELLAALPPAALRIDRETCDGLESVGLRKVAAMSQAPRAALVRRFGTLPALRLDQALGRVEEAVSPRLPVPELSVERHLAEPVTETAHVERLIALLSASLALELETRGLGARALDLFLCRTDGTVLRVAIGTSRPLREPRLVQKLFGERLAALDGRPDADCGFDLVRLSAAVTAPLLEAQDDFDGREGRGEELARFVDRVQARLGADALLQPVLAQSHVPERAAGLRPLRDVPRRNLRRGAASAPVAKGTYRMERPLRLFAPPEAVEVSVSEVPAGPPRSFLWRRVSYRVARAEGPERIGPEWWLHRLPEARPGPDRRLDEAQAEAARMLAVAGETARLTRDYFRVEDAEGRRFWLYREGLYGATPAQPRWFMHGLFA